MDPVAGTAGGSTDQGKSRRLTVEECHALAHKAARTMLGMQGDQGGESEVDADQAILIGAGALAIIIVSGIQKEGWPLAYREVAKRLPAFCRMYEQQAILMKALVDKAN